MRRRNRPVRVASLDLGHDRRARRLDAEDLLRLDDVVGGGVRAYDPLVRHHLRSAVRRGATRRSVRAIGRVCAATTRERVCARSTARLAADATAT